MRAAPRPARARPADRRGPPDRRGRDEGAAARRRHPRPRRRGHRRRGRDLARARRPGRGQAARRDAQGPRGRRRARPRRRRTACEAAAARLGGTVLVERMAPRGIEVLVAIRRDGAGPGARLGAGGVHTERLDDVAVIPLPADAARIAQAIDTLRTPIPPQPIADSPQQLQQLAARADRAQPRDRPRRPAPWPSTHWPRRPHERDRSQAGGGRPPDAGQGARGPHWDAVIVGGGHNGLTAAAYLAKAGQSVLVLERRERLGGACTLERPFPDERYSVSPCAYVVGLLDEVVIEELQLRQRGFECYVADPNLWVPFEDGTSFGQWLDDAKTQQNLERARRSPRRTSTATGPTSTSSTRSASACAPAAATPGSATRPRARRSRTCCTASRR